jgi:hypothetical protein
MKGQAASMARPKSAVSSHIKRVQVWQEKSPTAVAAGTNWSPYLGFPSHFSGPLEETESIKSKTVTVARHMLLEPFLTKELAHCILGLQHGITAPTPRSRLPSGRSRSWDHTKISRVTVE